MASGMPVLTWQKLVTQAYTSAPSIATASAISLALENPTYISGFNYETGEGWTSSNEATGTGWVTGGYALNVINTGGTSISPAVTVPGSGIVKYGANNVSRDGTSLLTPGVQGCTFYMNGVTTPTTKPIFCVVDFGGAYMTNNGTFGITWNGGSIFTIDFA